MKIHIKNIGMLDEAEFEVGDLTLICGENNTGKTYATYSLYGYLDFIGDNPKPFLFELLLFVMNAYSDSMEIQDDKMQISIENFKNVLIHLSEILRKNFKNTLLEVLAGKEEDVENSVFEDDLLLKFSSFIQSANNEENLKKVSDFFKYSPTFELYEINNKTIIFNYEKSKKRFDERMQYNVDAKRQKFWLLLIGYIFSRLYPIPFILSTERTGATMFQKELDVNKNEIVEQISRANGKNIEETVFNVLNARYSRYPKPVKDNIYFVRELDEVAKQTSFIKKSEKENPLYKEIIELLCQVVGGKYIVSPEGIEFAPGAKQRVMKGKILVQRASSSVRSLLMLNYYVLHRAQIGDILMIDEPELNLHPKNQILVARLLALLVNAGIKVFITTHSDYIVRELSNCIMLKNLSVEQIEKFKKQGYSKEYGLESKKVKAYLAENIKRKNTLKVVKITQEQGIFMETFDEPIDTQNENQGLIFEEVIRSKGDSNDNNK
ncbi:AAA family ATPase [Helicobacter turcicus]|uniref:AAA family ATPase n=1 Tax=Helicobacter turcicus TaxID=2867412 RepID=A0ABS7JMY1_9HELI|nr:AAA family ATPase [Helicobacter turcicus]MBX7490746.1 AAA family ATPase [Helicobacter turcicus]MBX7545645.1 AAA family ATPase [Helicobacter turcicus]